ncbi:ABC-three component system protein [Paenarthrobacter nitroguajacolicus]|uniref:ABC-three component system protein n=1 Tax=Paenarthrobacter nitroguajacolicus TaxID=211146 RepID=UPI0028620FA8|nr:ABC-three component system protein [Paenarthrobacter nitroguajacolicus]MDR6637426.1 uncharacterized protein YydD (DUF2326 family) [Paenarthrobacter nitroguajacolicus]
MNIAVAERTRTASASDSRNAVGKSSLVRTLDFLLGSSAGVEHVLRRLELAGYTFELTLEAGTQPVVIKRAGEAPNLVELNGQNVNLAALNSFLGSELFGLTGEPGEPTYRQLISYYLRSEADGAFQDATRTHSRQSNITVQGPLAYLFGLDLRVPARAREIFNSKKSTKALRDAAKDPVFGRAMGSVAQLEAEIATLSLERGSLERQLDGFRVVDRYSESLRTAEDLSRAIRKENDAATVALRRVRDLEHSLTEEDGQQPDQSYLAGIYEQVGVLFPERAIRSFAAVAEFHDSVVRNRRAYLGDELADAKSQLEARSSRIAELDSERAELMILLREGGALETFQEMQKDLGATEGRIAELRERLSSVQALKEAQTFLNKQSQALEDTTKNDLEQRREQVEGIRNLFSEYAYDIYGSRRPATLGIRESDHGYLFTPTLGGDDSAGVKSIEIFCFDLAMAVIAKRAGHGPDFLVHDSHLYDAVEARQIASALDLASRVCAAEDMQYVVGMNSDDLEKARAMSTGLVFHQCATMTDEYEQGGLFGVRFN